MLATLLVLVLQTLSGARTVDLTWHPAPGTVLERRVEFRVQADLGGGYASLLLDGAPALLAIHGRLHVRDELRRVGEGRPLELEREVLGLHTTWEGLVAGRVVSDLEDRALRYAWDAGSARYARTWAGPGSRAGTPPALREDLDLRAFLPEDRVRVGEVWRVPVSRAGPLLAPAGALHVDADVTHGWRLHELARAFDIERVQRIRDGEVECVLTRVDGDLALVEFGWTWWGRIDPLLTPPRDTWIGHLVGESLGADVEGRAWGRLWWDLAAGHARELELEVELEGRLGAAGTSHGIPFAARGAWWVVIDAR